MTGVTSGTKSTATLGSVPVVMVGSSLISQVKAGQEIDSAPYPFGEGFFASLNLN